MANEHISRTCPTCGLVKPLTAEFFHRHGNGFRHECKPCRSLVAKKRYSENAEHRKAQSRLDYAKNKKERYRANRDWCKSNSDKMREYRLMWREKNREFEREAYNNAMREKKASSGAFRMSCSISRAIWGVLRNRKSGAKWQSFVGYDGGALKRHIERQFSQGMSWDNYGEWHIDHIVPISSFIGTDDDLRMVRDCWALSNLRPLWARDNLSKNDRRIYLL